MQLPTVLSSWCAAAYSFVRLVPCDIVVRPQPTVLIWAHAGAKHGKFSECDRDEYDRQVARFFVNLRGEASQSVVVTVPPGIEFVAGHEALEVRSPSNIRHNFKLPASAGAWAGRPIRASLPKGRLVEPTPAHLHHLICVAVKSRVAELTESEVPTDWDQAIALCTEALKFYTTDFSQSWYKKHVLEAQEASAQNEAGRETNIRP